MMHWRRMARRSSSVPSQKPQSSGRRHTMTTGLGLAAINSPMSGDLPKRSSRISRTSPKCFALSMSTRASRRDSELMETQIMNVLKKTSTKGTKDTKRKKDGREEDQSWVSFLPSSFRFFLLRGLRALRGQFVLVGRGRFAQGRPFVVEAFVLDGPQLFLADREVFRYHFIGFTHALHGILRGDEMRKDFLFFFGGETTAGGHRKHLSKKIKQPAGTSVLRRERIPGWRWKEDLGECPSTNPRGFLDIS